MRLLIDTQIFIWAVIDSDHLSEHARRIMLDATEVFVTRLQSHGSQRMEHLAHCVFVSAMKSCG